MRAASQSGRREQLIMPADRNDNRHPNTPPMSSFYVVLWEQLLLAYEGVHPGGGSVFQIVPGEIATSSLTDTWTIETTHAIPQPIARDSLEVADFLCQTLEKFQNNSPCRIEIDGMEILDWQAWIEASLGQLNRSVFIRVVSVTR